MKQALLEALRKARSDRRSAVLVTDLERGAERLVDPSEIVTLPGPLGEAALQALATDQCQETSFEGRRLFLHPVQPQQRLIVVGAVHIAQPLVQMAAVAGFDVTVVDPRGAFASEARFPGVELRTEWPDEALESLQIDGRCAVVTLTHDPKLDDPALAVALRSGAFYIGSLGSRRTHAARLERLGALGFDGEALERIHGPVGLDIGARSPAEIAVSILAQVVATLRREN